MIVDESGDLICGALVKISNTVSNHLSRGHFLPIPSKVIMASMFDAGVGVMRPGGRSAMSMKRRILFVGEDQTLCQEFQAHCPETESDWTIQGVRSEEEALALSQQQTIAAVVADVNLNGKSGKDLLDAFMRRQPKALRIIVSDLADVASTIKCIGQAHHHVLKPCSAATLQHVVAQSFAQEAWLPSEHLQGFIAQMRQVPSPIKAYQQIVEEMKFVLLQQPEL